MFASLTAAPASLAELPFVTDRRSVTAVLQPENSPAALLLCTLWKASTDAVETVYQKCTTAAAAARQHIQRTQDDARQSLLFRCGAGQQGHAMQAPRCCIAASDTAMTSSM